MVCPRSGFEDGLWAPAEGAVRIRGLVGLSFVVSRPFVVDRNICRLLW
jgi:hypothetical protein